MRLILWWIGIVVAVVAVLIFRNMLNIPGLHISSFWIMTIAAGLFAIAGLIKNN